MENYDYQITKLQQEIDNLQNKIVQKRKDIEECESLIDTCVSVSSEIEESLDALFQNIDKNNELKEGNFISYFKQNITSILSDNGIFDISSDVNNEKNSYKKKILSIEDEIEKIQKRIHSLETELSHYQSLAQKKREEMI